MIDFGGGMENVSATTLGASALTDQRSGNYAMSGLNSHELAHQWFGDLVTCEDWGDSWLNESFATYFQQLYSEHFYGKDRFDLDRYGSLQSYLREAARYKRPLSTNLYASPDAMFDAHAYPKGALILHMLRRQLGDENFFRGLNRYLTVNRHKPVDTYDLQRALIDATGQNVKPFFDQWIFKPGHPVLETAWRYDEPGKAVVLTVKQTQDTAEDVPLYTLPLTIALLRQSSASAVERRQVTLDKAEQEFRLPVSEKPDAVLIDPDHDLLIELKAPKWTAEELPILLRSAPSALDRRAAANQMASGDSLSETAIQQLTAALPKEESEIVAEAILQRLGAAQKEALRPLFRSEIKAKQPNRRAAALEALAKLPPQPEDIALFRTVGLSDTELYRNVETALKALGEANAAAHLDVFRKQVAARSHRDRLAATVVEILAPKKLDAAAPIFIEATAFTHRPETRRAAIRALGSLAPGSAPTRQTLVNLLKEQERPSIQQAAIRALEARKEKEAVAALRALAASAAEEEVRQSAAKAADAIEGKGG
jgi:aminopeptidase N